jgi:peptidyl-prolyl cis-trans isomerase B (cyclophilin B)
VAGSVKRERQLARDHYERQQARRQQRLARRRRSQQIGAVVLALALVAGGIFALSVSLGDDDSTVGTKDTTDTGASASPTPTPSPSESGAAAGCTYSKTEGDAAKDVGLPEYDADNPESYRKPFAATLVTNRGDITIEMHAAEAPCTTNSFSHLASEGYFDKTDCHRLTTKNILVLQCGDPTGTGSGGPGYQFGEENLPEEAEANYPEGTVAMANAGSGTNGSQFFLVYGDTTLPPDYTIFGTITKGLDVLKDVAEAGSDNSNAEGDGKPVKPVTIQSVQIGKA